jgi:CMP-N,N'-diacetyllegionaminic acid synthase
LVGTEYVKLKKMENMELSKILVVIPARGGSKGIPKKNIKKLCGRELILYSTDLARTIFKDSQICVSTDSEEIKHVVEKTGLKVPFMRPKNIASDLATTHSVLDHAIKFYKTKNMFYEKILLLQPTSPFRLKKHIEEAIQEFTPNIDMIVSVSHTNANPYYTLLEESKEGLLSKSKVIKNLTRRQDCPQVFQLNGSIYVINIKSLENKQIHKFKKLKKYLMPVEYSIDIDSIFDWHIAASILEKKIINLDLIEVNKKRNTFPN